MPRPKLSPEEKEKRLAARRQRVKEKYAADPEIRKRKHERYLANKEKLNAYNNARYYARKKELEELRKLKQQIEQ
jgi:hypothetical protein